MTIREANHYMRISEATEQFIYQRRAEGLSPMTLTAYRLQMGLLARAIGDREINDITLADLRAYIGGPACEHLKPASVANRVRNIKSFFKWLQEEDYLARNVALKLREPKLPQRLPKALNFEESELVREACKTIMEHALIEFLFASGCRAAEVSRIQKADVDWERRSVRVIGKGNKEREVYFEAKTTIWLRRYLQERAKDPADTCPFLFVSERHPIRSKPPHMIWYDVKRIAHRVGMAERVWPHVMRHTLGTALLNRGAPLVVVQSILGHSDPKTTEIYAHLSGTTQQEAYRRAMMQ